MKWGLNVCLQKIKHHNIVKQNADCNAPENSTRLGHVLHLLNLHTLASILEFHRVRVWREMVILVLLIVTGIGICLQFSKVKLHISRRIICLFIQWLPLLILQGVLNYLNWTTCTSKTASIRHASVYYFVVLFKINGRKLYCPVTKSEFKKDYYGPRAKETVMVHGAIQAGKILYLLFTNCHSWTCFWRHTRLLWMCWFLHFKIGL
jgi:hypothetical protein